MTRRTATEPGGPFGDLVAVPQRGLVYGNRGCLHDDQGRIRRRYPGRRWIACRRQLRGWRRSPLLQPGRFPELFSLDEATAFAAGHRPCARCRSAGFRRFVGLWETRHPKEVKVNAIDRKLHVERLNDGRRGRQTHRAAYADLPDGWGVTKGSVRNLTAGENPGETVSVGQYARPL